MQLRFKFSRLVLSCGAAVILLFLWSYTFSPTLSNVGPLALVAKHAPACKPIRYKSDARVSQVFTNTAESRQFTREYLESFLDLPRDSVAQLKLSFAQFLNDLKAKEMESFGSVGNQLKGIVTIGGGKFTWLALLNISQIRSTGCTLPIEIFIPYNEHYDSEFCGRAEKSLNARCVRGPRGLNLKEFQWKIMAVYYSSFENVLFLDSDNTVLKNPSTLFGWDKYTTTGLVLWPDAWTRTTHPALYDIMGVEVPHTQGMFHANKETMQDPTNESGMFLVNKRKHANTLFVALYFNILGPDYYYPLITQGGAGEGDKDTFLTAAFALGMPHYVVHNTLHFVGYFRNGNDDFHSNALAHCNPVTKEEAAAFNAHARGGTCTNLMFIHLSFPKYYLESLGPNLSKNDKDIVLYETLLKFDKSDFEVHFWEHLSELICDDEPSEEETETPFYALGKTLQYIQQQNTPEFCKVFVKPHLRFLQRWFKKANRGISQFQQNIFAV